MKYYFCAVVDIILMASCWIFIEKVTAMRLKDVPNNEAARPIEDAKHIAQGLIFFIGGWILAASISGMMDILIH